MCFDLNMVKDFSYKSRTTTITTWVSEEDKALYKLLKDEYDVRVSKEIYKAMIDKLHELKEKFIPQKSA
jgi:hypothetical protein